MALPDYTVYSQLTSGSYMKKSDRSGPYAWDGAAMILSAFLDAAGLGTATTLVATSKIQLNSGASFELYNTVDKVTNFERLRAYWSGNTAYLHPDAGGTGASRDFRLGTSSAGSLVRYLAFFASGTSTNRFQFVDNGSNASSGTQTILSLAATLNQSGTAGATLFNIDSTNTALGSGAYLIQRWGWNGVEKGRLTSAGVLATDYLSAVQYMGLSSALANTPDVRLWRDASDVLALRRDTTPQTFRIYNTYMDASNYNRIAFEATASRFSILGQKAGTGTNRSMRILNETNDILELGTNNTIILTFAAVGSVYGATFSGLIKTGVLTVATLPAANTAGAGARLHVTDANSNTFFTIAASGGANNVPVFSDGVNWRIG
jgi:hypothetical protein